MNSPRNGDDVNVDQAPPYREKLHSNSQSVETAQYCMERGQQGLTLYLARVCLSLSLGLSSLGEGRSSARVAKVAEDSTRMSSKRCTALTHLKARTRELGLGP